MAVVIAFFVCYAPLYLQRVVLAIMTLNPNEDSIFLANFMAYLYVISGVTFYFGSVINPILYNVVSNKYRRAFADLFCCRLKSQPKKSTKILKQKFHPTSPHLPINNHLKHLDQSQLTPHGNQQIPNHSSKSNSSSSHFAEKNKRRTADK